MSLPFVHLRVHSDYSLGHGASKVKDLIKQVRALAQPALALTDTENLHGAFQMSKYCDADGVQPIIGALVHLPVSKKGDEKGSLVLIAQTPKGYANLCRLVNMDLTPDRPRVGVIDSGMLQQIAASVGTDDDMTADVICLSGSGADSYLGRMFALGGEAAAEKTARFLAGLFGDRFYVEICRNGYPTAEQVAVERGVLEVALKIDAPIVATTDAWYATEDRHDAFVLLLAVKANEKGGIVATEDEVQVSSPVRFHLRSSDEMWGLFHDLPEAYETALEIARRCAFKVEFRNPILPPFPTDGGRSEAEELRCQAQQGLETRLAKKIAPGYSREDYLKRLEFELGIIERMGFPGYFLIVSDFIKWSKANGIPVGPGRGSGAGSVVAWALVITDLDPLQFGLLFERFLNPERVSMPDFDIDFCQDRREEVIDYVEAKYGRSLVAQIATFMEIKSKTALRDVARVIMHPEEGGMSQMEINNFANMVPDPKNGVELKLKDVYDQVPEFHDRVEENARARLVYQYGRKVEGLFRNASAHAAGVIIAGDTLTKLVPVGFDAKTGRPIVQFNMKDAEAAGLVKFDFLGLKTLSIIREALANMEKVEGVHLDLELLPLDDKKTLDLFAKARTTGVFQFESDGMKNSLRDVKPDRIEDLIAINALFRPGPMAFIPDYAKRKAGREPPVYYNPIEKTRPYLEETFGIMVYQEQVMQVAQVVAGYSLGGADLLRRAMGKKIKAEMDAQRTIFVKGAFDTNGIEEKEAISIFESIEAFANYGFNKSHAAAYCLIAYHTAYLKAHHMASFFAALLSYEDKAERMALIKQDMDQFGVDFLPPDVNRSRAKFRSERRDDGALHIRFGLGAVKGVSAAAIDPMVEERERNGPFKDLIDFHVRVGKLFNSGQLLKLAEGGAFDSVNGNGNRHQAFEILSFLSKNNKRDDGMLDMFGGEAKIVIRQNVLDTPEWENLPDLEFGAVGFYFRQHPLDAFEKRLSAARLIKRRQSVIDHLINVGEAQRKGINLFGMVEEHNTPLGTYGFYNKVRFAERNQTYQLTIFTPRRDGQTFEEIKDLLDGAKKAKKPVVIEADFAPGSRGPSDFFVTGRRVWSIEQFMDEFKPPTTWRAILSQDKIDLIGSEALRLKEIGARADAGPPEGVSKEDFEDACFNETGEIVKPKFLLMLEMFHTALLTMSREVDSEDEADRFLIEIHLRAGKLVRKVDIGEILKGKYSLTKNAEHGLKSYVTSFKEVVDG